MSDYRLEVTNLAAKVSIMKSWELEYLAGSLVDYHPMVARELLIALQLNLLRTNELITDERE